MPQKPVFYLPSQEKTRQHAWQHRCDADLIFVSGTHPHMASTDDAERFSCEVQFATPDNDAFTPHYAHCHSILQFIPKILDTNTGNLECKFLARYAYDISITQAILCMLEQYIHLTNDTAITITTALHEALCNALIHGELSISSNFDDVASFDNHYLAIAEALKHASDTREAIKISASWDKNTLFITVENTAPDASKKTVSFQQKKNLETLHGRGLQIIKAYADHVDVNDARNIISMRFDLTPSSQSTAANGQSDEKLPSGKPTHESLKKSLILIADDTEFNRYMLKEILSKHGFSNFIEAKDGNDALEKTKKHKPELIIMDLMMPHMDGFQFCKTLRETDDISDIPVIIQSVLSNPQQRSNAFAGGATDFITKPINANELVARTLVHLERQKLLTDLKIYQARMRAELDNARDMQESLLPTTEHLARIQSRYQLSVSSHFQPSTEIGGDFWGLNQINDQHIAFYMVDFSGHGVSAALNTFRLHTVIQEMQQHADEPGKYVTHLNDRLCKLLAPGHFATMFYGVFDTQKHEISYATAASPGPFIINADTGSIQILDGTGYPLGILPNATFDTQHISFKKNDMLILYSDALIETENAHGACLSEDMLNTQIEKHLQNTKSFSAKLLLDYILATFWQHAGRTRHVPDDLTITVYQHS